MPVLSCGKLIAVAMGGGEQKASRNSVTKKVKLHITYTTLV